MLLFSRLRVGSKLALLAGIPVLGILILSSLVVIEVQERAQAAAGLGSIENLAQLTDKMLDVIDELQWERAQVTYDAGRGEPDSADAKARQLRTDAALAELDAFLARSEKSKLPEKLQQDLAAAHERLRGLAALRARPSQPDFDVVSYLDVFANANDSLIRATAALTQLSDDKQLMTTIGGLVSAMQVIERRGREHALLNYVFGKREFPPGTFRYLVTLVTEQEVYTDALRTWASEEEFTRLKAGLRGPEGERGASMRQLALESVEEFPEVDAKVWFETQSANMRAFSRMERDMANSVRAVVAAQMAAVQKAMRVAIGLVGAVAVTSVLIGLGVARSLTRSVRVLSAAAENVHQNHDFTIRAEKTSSDELGLLTDAFNGMLAGIQEREGELDNYRKNLEALVDARTRELSKRNDEMRIVLDNIDEGLATVDAQGRLFAECSRSFEQFFGPPAAGTPFHTVLAAGDEHLAFVLESGYEQYTANVLPVELALDQLPKQIRRGDRELALAFKPMLRDGVPTGALIVTRDITDELLARRVEAEQRERVQIFERIMRDRDGFQEFVAEAGRLMARLAEEMRGEDAGRMRTLHTLKGVAAVSDVGSVARAAHDLEQAIIDGKTEQVPAAYAHLVERWEAFSAFARPIIGADASRRVEIAPDELAFLIERVRDGASAREVVEALTRFTWEPVSVRFQRMAEQLRRVASRLEKPEPEVIIDAGGQRLPPERFRAFWSSLAHVVRNIVDHAIESEEERAQRGKTGPTRVRLRAFSDSSGKLCVEISDDGRGVDWQRLAQKAAERGLPTATRADLVQAIFSDGVSTAEAVSETSGRGVGMSAVRSECASLGGAISVDSERGKGTRFRFVFPSVIDDEGAISSGPRAGQKPVAGDGPGLRRSEPARA